MSRPKNYDVLKRAIMDYLSVNQMDTSYKFSCDGGVEDMWMTVSDPPADYDPQLGLLQDGPEYRLKPVLIARMQPDGSVAVEETEYTAKYMTVKKAAVV